MILHTGVDGGLHDVVLANLLGVIAWGLVGVNAIVYWTRAAVRHFKRGK